jgi:hypothetical protein
MVRRTFQLSQPQEACQTIFTTRLSRISGQHIDLTYSYYKAAKKTCRVNGLAESELRYPSADFDALHI